MTVGNLKVRWYSAVSGMRIAAYASLCAAQYCQVLRHHFEAISSVSSQYMNAENFDRMSQPSLPASRVYMQC